MCPGIMFPGGAAVKDSNTHKKRKFCTVDFAPIASFGVTLGIDLRTKVGLVDCSDQKWFQCSYICEYCLQSPEELFFFSSSQSASYYA